MRTGIPFTRNSADRRRLENIAADRNTPQKPVWRTRIVPLSANGIGTNAIMAAAGTAKTTVRRWQTRFMDEGVDGLLRGKTRPPGKAPITDERTNAVVTMTLKPLHEATPLDGDGDGQGSRARCFDGAEDLQGSRSRAPSPAALQALDRSRFRRDAA